MTGFVAPYPTIGRKRDIANIDNVGRCSMRDSPVPKSKKRPKQIDLWPPIARKLAGRWVAFDEWATDVKFVIRSVKGGFRVNVVDRWDGEKAEVFDVKATKTTLSFAAYWSSGQLTKYRLRLLRDDQIHVVYSYTATNTFRRERADDTR
jgi:hypothetical protein